MKMKVKISEKLSIFLAVALLGSILQNIGWVSNSQAGGSSDSPTDCIDKFEVLDQVEEKIVLKCLESGIKNCFDAKDYTLCVMKFTHKIRIFNVRKELSISDKSIRRDYLHILGECGSVSNYDKKALCKLSLEAGFLLAIMGHR